MPSPSTPLFDLALAAANKKGPKFPARLVIPAIQEAVSSAADVLKDKGRNPLEAFPELALLKIVADYMEPEEQITVKRALSRISLDEARIFRALGASSRFPIPDRLYYFKQAAALVETFLSSNDTTPNDRACLLLDRIEYMLDHCNFLKSLLNRRRDTVTSKIPQHTYDYYDLRELAFTALNTLQDEQLFLNKFQAQRIPLIQQRLVTLGKRGEITCPPKSELSRKLAIEQNIGLLQTGIFRDLAAIRAAINVSQGLYGAGDAMSSNYIGHNAQLGQFTIFLVAQYLAEKLGTHGNVVALSVPYTEGEQKPINDFDIVFRITKKSNTFALPVGIYFGEVKTILGNTRGFLKLTDRRDDFIQLRRHEKERRRLVGLGLPAKSQLMLIELFPDETSHVHVNDILPIGMRHLTIRTPFKRVSPKMNQPLSIDDSRREAWAKEPATVDGLIQFLQ